MANMRIDDEVYSKLKYLAGQAGVSASSYIGSLIDGTPVSSAGDTSRLLHEKLDTVIGLLTNKLPEASPAESGPVDSPPAPTTSWQKVEPAGAPDDAVLDKLRNSISLLEDELVYCQDQESANKLYGEIDKLQKEKNAILLERNNNE